jgi:hypothetical protein
LVSSRRDTSGKGATTQHESGERQKLRWRPGVAATGPNPLEVAGQQRITLDMLQYEFEVGYAGKN